ncbi:hypothetical protein Taro_002062 [Colocasia esculenta]|uniref:Uncharacterized protein n=1 Tax=Colocasia esculenta TaxID=4460 RepID=A0A843TJW1_COLES|nr:hypothetical protein [Colocasia esculenta]
MKLLKHANQVVFYKLDLGASSLNTFLSVCSLRIEGRPGGIQGIQKRLRKCHPWFRKPSPNGNPTLPNFVSDPSPIKHPISGQI